MPSTQRPVTVPLVLVCCAAFAVADDALVEWAKANAVPLRTVEFTTDDNDLAAPPEMVGDARVIDLSSVPAAGPVREWFERPQRSMLAQMFSLLDPVIEAWNIVVFVDDVRRATPVAPVAADD
jgi:hypothetical protein